MKNILMNVEMTKAILDGRKVQTRRVMAGCDTFDITCEDGLYSLVHNYKMSIESVGLFSTKEKLFKWFSEKYSKYQIGETIWVREPARVVYFQNAGNYGGSWIEDYAHVEYLADNHVIYHWDEFPENPKSWLWECKGIPNGCCKSLARIFLKITNVRVERLQDISEEDCIKEGIRWQEPFLGMMADPCDNYPKREVFEWLWDSISPKGYKWEDNPYVFVYEFERVDNENKK